MFTAIFRSTRRDQARAEVSWRPAALGLLAGSLIAGARTAGSAGELVLASGLLPATLLILTCRLAATAMSAQPVGAERWRSRGRR